MWFHVFIFCFKLNTHIFVTIIPPYCFMYILLSIICSVLTLQLVNFTQHWTREPSGFAGMLPRGMNPQKASCCMDEITARILQALSMELHQQICHFYRYIRQDGKCPLSVAEGLNHSRLPESSTHETCQLLPHLPDVKCLQGAGTHQVHTHLPSCGPAYHLRIQKNMDFRPGF